MTAAAAATTSTATTALATADTVETAAEKGQMKIIDLVKNDNNSTTKCLVENTDTKTREWIAVEDIRIAHPLLLINYYESRIEVVDKK